MASMNMEIRPQLRPCYVKDKNEVERKALFHRWYVHNYVEDAILAGSVGGQCSDLLALVELEDGRVVTTYSIYVRFVDNAFDEYSWEESDGQAD